MMAEINKYMISRVLRIEHKKTVRNVEKGKIVYTLYGKFACKTSRGNDDKSLGPLDQAH